MAKQSLSKNSLVITWPRSKYYSDHLPKEIFQNETNKKKKISHPILIDKKTGDFSFAKCWLTVKGSVAVLDYRGQNAPESLVEDGIMTVNFKGKGRKVIKSIDYIGPDGKLKKDAAKASWREVNDSVLEGKRSLKEFEFISRNSSFMSEKKAENNHCCEACGYRLKVNGLFIIDCHHKDPVSMGEGKTRKSDLLVLCPNCHRIAHTNNPPLKRDEIRKVLKEAGVQVVISK